MKKFIKCMMLLPILALSCCNALPTLESQEGQPLSTIPPYTPPTPPEQGRNIDSIDILGIPEDTKIGMGLFNEANIRCQINYTDGSNDAFQLLEENLPYEIREMLGVEGEHTVTIQIRNKTASFKITMVDEGIRYIVSFLNYNDEVLQRTKVMPNNKVSYFGENPKRMSDIVYKYKFEQRDHDLDTYLVDQSTVIYPIYEYVFKSNDYLPNELGHQIVAKYREVDPQTGFDTKYVCSYIGRVTNFPIARDMNDQYVAHTKGNKETINFNFSDIDSPINPPYTTSAFHPNIEYTLHGIISESYKYENPGEAIDPKYIPTNSQILSDAKISDLPFELHSVRTRNREGKTYDTKVTDYVDVINSFLNPGIASTLHIPEDFPSGQYTATLFMDVDVYAYVYAEDRGNLGILNSTVFVIGCPAEIYVGLNSKEYEMVAFNYKTTTYDEDMMSIEIFADMMKEARKAFEG